MTTFTALTIQPDGTHQVTEVNPDDSLQFLQEQVGGYVFAQDAPEGVTFWGHDEGKLIGLPLNSHATALWWVLDERFVNADVLVGPIVLTGWADNDGETLGLPANVLDRVLTVLS